MKCSWSNKRREGSGSWFSETAASQIKETDNTAPPTETSPDQALPCSPLSWVERLKRVFDIDIPVCPLSGGTLRVIADVADPDACKAVGLWLIRHRPSSTEKLHHGLLFAKKPIKILLKPGINAV